MLPVHGLVRGQMLAVFVAGTGVFAESLSHLGFHAPTFLSGINYALLALVFTFVNWYQSPSSKSTRLTTTPNASLRTTSNGRRTWIEMCEWKRWLPVVGGVGEGSCNDATGLHATIRTPLSAAASSQHFESEDHTSQQHIDQEEERNEQQREADEERNLINRSTLLSHSSDYATDDAGTPTSRTGRPGITNEPLSQHQNISNDNDDDASDDDDNDQKRKGSSLSTQVMLDDAVNTQSSRRWLWFMLLALADVEGNFLLTTAYKYTDITSVMLLDCFTIPCVMLLSRIVLHSSYSRMHMVGVSLCLVGLVAAVMSDHGKSQQTPSFNPNTTNAHNLSRVLDDNASVGPSNPVFGDLLCLIGAGFYAVANVGQEVLMKQDNQDNMVLYLRHIGICGAIISALQVWALEMDALREIEWTPTIVAYVFGFVACLFCMYTQVPLFLRSLDATLLNLSLLTADVWAVVAGIFLFKAQLSALYFVSLALILCGVVVYNLGPSPHTTAQTQQAIDGSSSNCDSRGELAGFGDDDVDDEHVHIESTVVDDGRGTYENIV